MNEDTLLPTTPYALQDTPSAEFPPAGIPETVLDEPAGEGLRGEIAKAKKIVVKLGSSSVTDENYAVSAEKINRFVDACQARMEAGTDVIIVSSGAVAAGMAPMGLKSRPGDLATKQAAASVGQVHLAYQWGRSFARYGRTTGQVLLTASDAAERSRARNAQRTVERLRQLRCVPIINENDTVATSELRFGDNDRLAAIVAHLIRADALVLLSDVDGLYDRNPAEPGAKFVSDVTGPEDLAGVVAGDGGKVGTGGMASKVSAARLASRGGIPVLLASADNIGPALASAQVGTVFHPEQGRLKAWNFWALYAADVSGVVRVDEGAARVVQRGGSSLLAVGITEVDGEFRSGDIVEIQDPKGTTIARGEVSYDAKTLHGMLGKHTHELPEGMKRPVIHADYLSSYSSHA
ncbi:glutamate 5-kinase [Corynebacterium sp. TAE3-ERU2]|uniref:glutamate 5-kinase n=1 Tax=Corynebacterium sp. TAE3-ERU2 TaxID=2849497 RepID=UPI001C491E8D|nr:glutamate 5-kinase [Corynebacterium sp. TAE3-ERU2]MBV7301452.1 glutamate 5-kinase [Corynebacterium sp. TAE3-ERU2]